MVGMIVGIMAVVIGGLMGTGLKGYIPSQVSANLNAAFGISAIGMGVSSVVLMENMPPVILSVVLGTAIGLVMKIDDTVKRGGCLLQKPIAKLLARRNVDQKIDEEFLNTLVTALVLFCTSSSGVYGCLDAGMTGNSTVLLSKAILDFFTAIIFSCKIGAVTALIAIPQTLVFFGLYFSAKLILPLATPVMILDFKACGGILMLAAGFRVAKIRDFPIADMLPSMVLVFPLSKLWTTYIVPWL